MPKLTEFSRSARRLVFLGVAPNTLRNWHAAGKIPVFRNPISQYRLFKKTDLEKLLRQIEKSGTYPTGWKRDVPRNRKPR